MRSLLLLVAFATTAHADFGQALDQIDDEPFAQELRAAFGREIAACTADGCKMRLEELECTTGGCHARDVQRFLALSASGPAAATVARHLTDLGANRFDRTRTAAARVICTSSDRSEVVSGFHGHCSVLLRRGDDTLADGLTANGFADEKLGGTWWTGHVRVRCDAGTPVCHASCITPTSDDWERCPDGQTTDLTDPTFAAEVRQRAGDGPVSIFCGGKRDQGWDGGLLDVSGCSATPAP